MPLFLLEKTLLGRGPDGSESSACWCLFRRPACRRHHPLDGPRGQNVESPGGKVHVQARIVHLIPAVFIPLSGKEVGHLPSAAGQVLPGQPDHPLGSRVREVHDDQTVLLGAVPGPGHQVQETGVVRPARAPAELPVRLPQSLQEIGIQKRLVERLEVRVDRLLRTAAEEDRKLDLPSLKLPFVEESRAGKGSDGYGRGTLLGREKKSTRPGAHRDFL